MTSASLNFDVTPLQVCIYVCMYVCMRFCVEKDPLCCTWLASCPQNRSCLACTGTINEAKPGRNSSTYRQMEHNIIYIMVTAGDQQDREEIFNHYTQQQEG